MVADTRGLLYAKIRTKDRLGLIAYKNSLQNRVCLRDVACVDDIIRPLEDDGRYVVKSTLYLKNGHPDLVLLVEYARRDYEITENQKEKLVKAFHEGKLYS